MTEKLITEEQALKEFAAQRDRLIEERNALIEAMYSIMEICSEAQFSRGNFALEEIEKVARKAVNC